MIQSCVSLTKRAHKLEETGVPSKMHPRDKVTAHLPASQRKEDTGECPQGSAEPWGCPNPDEIPSRCGLVGDSNLSSRSRCPGVSLLKMAGTDLLGL